MTVLDSPDKIAEAGEAIYDQKYRADLEQSNFGHFVAIDVTTGEKYVAQFPEVALQAAQKAAPNGIFHLIRIGAKGAFKVSFGRTRHDFWGRSLRSAR
jgi:hypothetical protein